MFSFWCLASFSQCGILRFTHVVCSLLIFLYSVGSIVLYWWKSGLLPIGATTNNSSGNILIQDSWSTQICLSIRSGIARL